MELFDDDSVVINLKSFENMGEEIKEGGHNTRVQINHINLGNENRNSNFIF